MRRSRRGPSTLSLRSSPLSARSVIFDYDDDVHGNYGDDDDDAKVHCTHIAIHGQYGKMRKYGQIGKSIFFDV